LKALERNLLAAGGDPPLPRYLRKGDLLFLRTITFFKFYSPAGTVIVYFFPQGTGRSSLPKKLFFMDGRPFSSFFVDPILPNWGTLLIWGCRGQELSLFFPPLKSPFKTYGRLFRDGLFFFSFPLCRIHCLSSNTSLVLALLLPLLFFFENDRPPPLSFFCSTKPPTFLKFSTYPQNSIRSPSLLAD